MPGVSVLSLVVSACCIVGTAMATRCDVSAPQLSLSELHPGCSSNQGSRHPDCVSAMHRFCGRVTYPSAIETLGVSRERTTGIISMSCVRSAWSGNVPIITLAQYNGGCTHAWKSQHHDCLTAIHKYCMDKLGGRRYAGTSQEVPSGNALYVKCFESPRKERVREEALAAKHGGCTLFTWDMESCYAAASRWCRLVGYAGGITQEGDRSGITVACYNAEFSNDVFTTRSNAFFHAEFRVAHICTLNFDIDEGDILSETPQFLKMETYDNRASRVDLNSNFEVSMEVAELSSFTHTHSLTIGADTTISARLPFFGGSDITLSTSFMTEVSLTTETTRTTSYSTSSAVSVPAGEGIVKEALVQRANLDVPWTARVINGLGAVLTIGGQWRGVNTYNFRVTQRDIEDGFCPCA